MTKLSIDWNIALTVTNVLSSVVVAGFAWAQWQLTKRHERTRRSERAEDRGFATDAAFAAVHAEWFRIWTVAHQWGKGDLIAWAESEQISPEDILPRDWASATEALGQLGYMSSYLGSLGFATAHDAAKVARAFVGNVQVYFEGRPSIASEAEKWDSSALPRLRAMEKTVKEVAGEAADLLQDALDHSPSATAPRNPEFRANLHSARARQLAAQVATLNVAGPEARSAVKRVYGSDES